MNPLADPATENGVEKPAPTPRSRIEARIREERLPMSTKKFAAKLLERNILIGDKIAIPMSDLRRLCHAPHNIDMVKHLRRLTDRGLIAYQIQFDTQHVEIAFVDAPRGE